MDFPTGQFADITSRESQPDGRLPVFNGRPAEGVPRCGGDCAACPYRVLHEFGIQPSPGGG
jgi:hypothetical protein